MTQPVNHRPDATAELTALMRERVVVMDGAMGTLLQRQGWPRPTSAASGSPTGRATCRATTTCSPDPARPRSSGIHTGYLDAGADLIETNTFNAQRISLADYGMSDLGLRDEPRRRAARPPRLRRRRGARPGRRAGCSGALGPTNRTASISPDVNDPAPATSPSTSWSRPTWSRPRGLVDGGADVLIIETIFDTLNAKAAIFAVETLFEQRGAPLAGDHLRDDHRRVRPDAVRPGDRGVLELGPPRRPLAVGP